MAINYKVLKCKNPNGVDGTTYASCRAVKVNDYTFDDLADDIAYATTCTKGDAMAVLASIKPFIVKALLGGRRVVLNDLGSFVIGIHGKCFPQAAIGADEFSPSAMIKGWRVLFRPEVALKKELTKGVKYQRLSSEMMV